MNRDSNKFAKLAVSGEQVFHVDDLANLWSVTNKNTLHTTVKRYVQKDLLFRIYKGFYSIKPIDKVDSFLLGVRAMHQFSYISTETILSRSGIIQQEIPYITLISTHSKKFSIGERAYRSRQLFDGYLYNPEGIVEKNGVNVATIERAIADMLYFNPKFNFDAGAQIDWKRIHDIQKKIGYPVTAQRFKK